jgi:glucose/arabinose dehydrogenase
MAPYSFKFRPLASLLCLIGVAGASTPTDAPLLPAPVDRCAMSRYWPDTYRPSPAFSGQTRAPAPARASRYQVEVLATGLVHPWSLAFLPGRRMLVTERPGRMRIVSRDGAVSPPLLGLPPIKLVAGEGLHDVILDRQFANNRTIYFTYFAPLADGVLTGEQSAWLAWLALPAGEHEAQAMGTARLARAQLSQDDTRLENVQVILEGADRRIVQSGDGTLLVLGSAPAGGVQPVDDEPQRLGNTYGKVLRINSDGSIPKDNPFVGQPGARPEIFALGQRDQEGAALHPRTGELWTVEHGPRGGDELNLVRRGRNYGFPLISYGRNYSGEPIFEGKTAQAGLEQPVYFWTPSIAPSGLLFYTGKLFPQWRHSLFVGGLSSKRLVRLEMAGDRVVAEEPLLLDRCRRIRDVRQGPEGALYVLTEEADGELLRITPRP